MIKLGLASLIIYSLIIAANAINNPEVVTSLDLHKDSTSTMKIKSSSGCALPSGSPDGAVSNEPGTVGGPKEAKNNPSHIFFPSPGCKIDIDDPNK